MKVKMILAALTEAKNPFWRPIKYSLFPPLGLATLAAYLHSDDEVSICDEHVEKLRMDDFPDLVVIQAYVTSAYRCYEIADFNLGLFQVFYILCNRLGAGFIDIHDQRIMYPISSFTFKDYSRDSFGAQ